MNNDWWWLKYSQNERLFNKHEYTKHIMQTQIMLNRLFGQSRNLSEAFPAKKL